MNILENDWAPLLEQEFEKEYYEELRQFLKKRIHRAYRVSGYVRYL